MAVNAVNRTTFSSNNVNRTIRNYSDDKPLFLVKGCHFSTHGCIVPSCLDEDTNYIAIAHAIASMDTFIRKCPTAKELIRPARYDTYFEKNNYFHAYLEEGDDDDYFEINVPYLFVALLEFASLIIQKLSMVNSNAERRKLLVYARNLINVTLQQNVRLT
jgi:hypothetical protein